MWHIYWLFPLWLQGRSDLKGWTRGGRYLCRHRWVGKEKFASIWILWWDCGEFYVSELWFHMKAVDWWRVICSQTCSIYLTSGSRSPSQLSVGTTCTRWRLCPTPWAEPCEHEREGAKTKTKSLLQQDLVILIEQFGWFWFADADMIWRLHELWFVVWHVCCWNELIHRESVTIVLSSSFVHVIY